MESEPPAGNPAASSSPRPAPTPPPLPDHADLPAPAAVPPVIALPARAPSTDAPVLAGRLHPFTLLFAAWDAFRNILIPFLLVAFFGRNRGEESYLLLGGLLLGLPLAIAAIRYFTFTYRIEGGELITRQGLLNRTQRNIPLQRVQDIRIEQGLLHRWFQVAEVHVETAGGQGAEASLAVLSLPEANRLRNVVFQQSGGPAGVTAPQAPARELIRQLTLRDLILAGLTSNQLASVLALLAVAWGVVDDIIPEKQYERWIEQGSKAAAGWIEHGAQGWVLVVSGMAMLVLVGIAFSVLGSIVVFYNFTLSRAGQDLHRSFGLLTRRSSSLPLRRIQVLKVEETLLRRIFRLATLRADTAASKATQTQGTGGRDVLLPIVPRAELDSLLPVFFPDLDHAPGEWRQVSRRAIRRGTTKGLVVCLAASTVFVAITRSWLGCWPVALIPIIYVLNVLDYRHLGYWWNGAYFRSRRGWLRRATHIAPIRNAQSIVVRQTPFDRRHRVATLLVDTAGQAYTGGTPQVANVPAEEAMNFARVLAHRAATTRYTLK